MSVASKLAQLGRVLSDARWWPFYLQRRFMGAAAREGVSDFIARRLRPQIHGSPDALAQQRIVEMREAGITRLGPLLTPDQAVALRDYFRQKPVTDPYRGGASFLPEGDGRHPEAHIAHHEPRDILLAPHLLALANRPEILQVVEGLIGCRPTIGYLACWWSYHTAIGAQQAEHFHRDVDDWRFFKLFVYLSDVDAANGPHVYVSHSASSERLREIRRFTDSEVEQAFGAERILKMTGKAGEGFLENTFGVHKGQPVAEGRRLIFQAVYSMYPLPYGPSKPVMSASESALAGSADPWVNRLYLHFP